MAIPTPLWLERWRPNSILHRCKRLLRFSPKRTDKLQKSHSITRILYTKPKLLSYKFLPAGLPDWLRASVLVISLSLFGKALGFLREIEAARLFGIGMEVDAFVAASTLLFFICRMASDSLLINTPVLLEGYQNNGAQVPWGEMFRSLLFVSIVLTLLAWLLLPPIVPVLFGGLSQDARQLTVQLVVVMLPLVIGWTMVGALGGVHNAQHRYSGYHAALIVTNGVILVTLWLFAQRIGIKSLAYGWVVGIGLGVLVVVYPLRHQWRQITMWNGWVSQWLALRSIVWGSGGLSLWFLLNQVPVWIERYYAAQLPTGSLAALGYAQRLFQLPLEMVTAVVISVWVTQVVSMPADRVAQQTFRLMGRLAAVTFPISLLLALFARPVISLVYARGAFDAYAVTMTAGPFAMYALGWGFHTLSAVLVRTFQARGLVRYPLLAVVVDILLTFFLNIFSFRQGWGSTGIAAINSVVAGVRVVVLSVCAHFLEKF